MPAMASKRRKTSLEVAPAGYDALLGDVARVIEEARHAAARSVNAVMTTTYWLIGQRLVEEEQQGAPRAGYGERLLKRLSHDLSRRFGRGFSERNLEQMRAFYLGWPISQTPSAKSLAETLVWRRRVLDAGARGPIAGVAVYAVPCVRSLGAWCAGLREGDGLRSSSGASAVAKARSSPRRSSNLGAWLCSTTRKRAHAHAPSA